uniref:Integrase catalytic domain-containing protein n=1 Tax=Tanacetum cinerariifolium TaxID=118510 RepID=A0A6L2NVL0_TANCI|nr:hypothetical protein [Tanacetum cinerariifolium]
MGGEYLSIEFFDHLKNYGIVSQLTPSKTPQLNRVAERRNKTLLDMVKSMMSRATLPISFWGYVLEIAAHIVNLVPTKKVLKTPFETWKGKRHSLGPSKSGDNVLFIAQRGVFLKKEMISKEDSGSKIDLEEIQESADEEPIVNTDTQQEVVTPVNLDDISLPIRKISGRVSKPPQLYYGFHIEEDKINDSTLSELDEPANYKEAMASPETANLKTMGCKCIFKKKTDMDGKVHAYKARLLVARISASMRKPHSLDFLEAKWGPAYMTNESVVVFLLLYVDDTLLIGGDISTLQSVKDWLGKCFAMKDLGDATYIIGIKIYRDRSKRLIGLSQYTYLDKILRRFKMENSKKGNLPLHHGIKISKDLCPKIDEELDRTSRVPYASVVGSIMYAMTCTRPDVSFALSMKSSKQDTVANFTCESEYIAAYEASKEAIWMKNFIGNLRVVPTVRDFIEILCDNESTDRANDSRSNVSFDTPASPELWTELMTLDLTYPSIHQLLQSSSSGSGPDLVPLGLNKVVSFEVVCRDLNIVPTVTLFRMFQCLCKQGDWFSFSKRRNTEDVCMDDGPSSLKKWKDKFFLIDRRAIPDFLTWIYSCSCVSVDIPTNVYDWNDVERLSARLIYLREMREEVLVQISIHDFMTLPSWGDAKVVEESHHLSSSLLDRVSLHTTTLATKGAMIMLPTEDEIDASLSDPRLAKKSKGLLQVRVLAASDTTPESSRQLKRRKLRKRASKPGSSAPNLGQTEVHASTSGRSLSLGVACGILSSVVSGHAGNFKAEDDFGTVTHGEEIELTLFPFAPGLYHMPYPYEGVSSPLYTKEEWDRPHASESNILCKDIFKDSDVCRKALDQTITPADLRRTESLLPLELSNRVNFLSALLKKADVRLLRLEVTSLDNKLEKLQRGYDALGLTEELIRTDAKLSEQGLTVRDLQNKLALERSKSQGYKNSTDELRAEVAQFIGSGVEGLVRRLLSSDEFHTALAHVASLGINYGVERGLHMRRTDADFKMVVQKVSNFQVGAKADFDKALVDFPTTPFPFHGKVVAATGGTLSEVAQILPNKFARSAASASTAPSGVNEAPDQVPL